MSAIPAQRPAVRKRQDGPLAPLLRRTRRWSPTTRRVVFTLVPLVAFGAVSLLAGPAVAAIILAVFFSGAAFFRPRG
ncbi:hypothetical protein GCM10022247_01310 [Allokutzneria multivorans]|uniref:Uncharacterized protein n=1 Tax=Allokutzneria multivorans TaxID=1142134 RepID=A0ABP7QQZ5_9PSEU